MSPAGHLRACLEEVGKFRRDDSENGIMLSHALIADSDGDYSGSPVSHEAFNSSIEDWLTADDFGTSPIDLKLLVPV